MVEKYFDINEAGYSVRCKLYCGNVHDVKRAVIFGHGFGGHMDNKACEKFAGKLISKHKDFGVVAFNWPCHGDDARKNLMLSECDMYLTFVLDHVRKQFGMDADSPEIYAYATSFGAYLFLKYIADHSANPFKKAALRCPAITIYDSMIHRILSEDDYAKICRGKPVLAGFDRKIKIGKQFLEELQAADITQNDYMDYADDILIIHGTKDEIIPYEVSEQFADKNVIELIPMQNGDHRFTDPRIMDFAIHTIIEFFES